MDWKALLQAWLKKSKLSELEENGPAISPPMADYSIEGLGKTEEVLTIV